MHENSGNAVIFYAFYTQDGAGDTGLTVTVDVYEVIRDGTATLITNDGACTEIGGGLYRYLLASGSVDAAAEYVAIFHTADTDTDQKDLPAMWVIDRAGTEKLDAGVTLADDAIAASKISADAVTELQTGLALEATLTAIKGVGWSTETLAKIVADIAAISAGSGASAAEVWAYAMRTLTGFTTTEFHVIGPVRNDGKIDAIAGDDYYAADGRGMQWSDTAWPNLTGATVNFISGSTTIAMSVVTAGTGEQTVNLDVPKATSAAMKGEFKFIIQATLTNGHVATLLEGEGTFK